MKSTRLLLFLTFLLIIINVFPQKRVIYPFKKFDGKELQEAIDKCYNSGDILILPRNATFKCSNLIALRSNIDGNNSTLMFYGNKIENLCIIEDLIKIERLRIDGINVQDVKNGLFVKSNMKGIGTCYINIDVRNLKSNSEHDVNGISIYKNNTYSHLKNKFYIRANIENIIGKENHIIGDLTGSATGISYYSSSKNSADELILEECNIKNISNHEDSQGIYIGCLENNIQNKVLINKCSITNALKRGVKIQHPNVKITNCYVDNSSIAYDSYAPNTSFKNCNGFNCKIYFHINSNKCLIEHSELIAKTPFPSIQILSCKDIIISNISIQSLMNYPSIEHNIIYINASEVEFNNLKIKGTNKTGSAIVIQGNSHVKIKAGIISYTNTGIYSKYANGDLYIEDVTFKGLSKEYRKVNSYMRMQKNYF